MRKYTLATFITFVCVFGFLAMMLIGPKTACAKDYRIYSSDHTFKGSVRGDGLKRRYADRIYNAKGTYVGQTRSNRIYSSDGSYKGEIRKGRIYDSQGTFKYDLNRTTEKVYDRSGKFTARVSQ